MLMHDKTHQELDVIFQNLVNELLKSPQFAQYVKEAKLSLLDSSYEPIDRALRAGVLKGYEPNLMVQIFGE